MSQLVSVVVPVFNGMPHLPALVHSVLSQTYSELDIVFTEGGSTDDSASFLASIEDQRVRVITVPAGTTAAQNWTAASEAARGELVKLVCQDDLLHADAVAKQVADLELNPTAGMAIAQRDIVDANGKVLYARRGCAGLQPGLNPGSNILRECFLRGTNLFGEPVAVMFRRQALHDALPWDDSDPYLLDLSLYTTVAKVSDVVVRKESIGAFRVSASSWSTRLIPEQVRQFRRWQDAYAATAEASLSVTERARAKAGLHAQALLRRAAYRWLKMTGSLGT